MQHCAPTLSCAGPSSVEQPSSLGGGLPLGFVLGAAAAAGLFIFYGRAAVEVRARTPLPRPPAGHGRALSVSDGSRRGAYLGPGA